MSIQGLHQGSRSPRDSWRLLGSGVLCSGSDWLEIWKRTSPGHDVCPQGTCPTAMGTWAGPDGTCVTDKKEGSWGLHCLGLWLFMFPPHVLPGATVPSPPHSGVWDHPSSCCTLLPSIPWPYLRLPKGFLIAQGVSRALAPVLGKER